MFLIHLLNIQQYMHIAQRPRKKDDISKHMSATHFYATKYKKSTMILIVSNTSEENAHILVCVNIFNRFNAL